MWVCACGWWGVHGDHVGVYGESAGGDANLASVEDTDTKRKFDWAHEIDLFSVVYEWTLTNGGRWISLKGRRHCGGRREGKGHSRRQVVQEAPVLFLLKPSVALRTIPVQESDIRIFVKALQRGF